MKSRSEHAAPAFDRWAIAVAVSAAVLLHSAIGVWLIGTQRSAGVARQSAGSPIVVTLITAASRESGAMAQSTLAATADRGDPSSEQPQSSSVPTETPTGKSVQPARVQAKPLVQSVHQPTRRDEASLSAADRAMSETAGARYRAAADLDPPPRPLEEIQPEYPDSAGLQEGTVVLRLLINSSGEVDEVTVVDASPMGLFEASAVAAFRTAKFAPGRYRGVPVASQMKIAVDYTPTNRGGAISGQGGPGFLK